MRPSAFAVLALIAGGACASQNAANPPEGAATQQAAAPASHNRDILGRDELSKPTVVNMTVLDAIRTLRPNFLTVRGLNTIPASNAAGDPVVDGESGKVHVSIDGNKIVGLDELNNIRAGSIAEVRLLSPAAAMQRFGGEARNGPVLLVKLM